MRPFMISVSGWLADHGCDRRAVSGNEIQLQRQVAGIVSPYHGT
jgi:hypothetical protein